MINQSAKILEGSKATSASNIDIIWICGYAWPIYRGGPLFFGNTVGPPVAIAKIREFEPPWGRFYPCQTAGTHGQQRHAVSGLEVN